MDISRVTCNTISPYPCRPFAFSDAHKSFNLTYFYTSLYRLCIAYCDVVFKKMIQFVPLGDVFLKNDTVCTLL